MKERKNNIYVYIALDVKKDRRRISRRRRRRCLVFYLYSRPSTNTGRRSQIFMSYPAAPLPLVTNIPTRPPTPGSLSHAGTPIKSRFPGGTHKFSVFFFFYPPPILFYLFKVHSSSSSGNRQTVSASFGKTKQNKKVFGQFHNTLKKYL